MTAEELIAACDANGFICPMPVAWSRLWKALPHQRRHGIPWAPPPPPLILAAWSFSNDEQKRRRFAEHITWASEHGALEVVTRFVGNLEEGEWYRTHVV